MARAKLYARFLAVALLFVGACRRPTKAGAVAGKAKGHNVLFLTLDTTRADHLGCYGYKDAVTPALDSLAQRGVLFENAYCQAPITLVSHCTMMTGLYPREHGIRGNNGSASLSPGIPTLSTLFRKSGYRTGGFIAAYVLDTRFGLNQGFETYNDDMGHTSPNLQQFDLQVPGNVVTDRALAWLETVKDSPFFCWVHYYDPHEPYFPPPEFQKANGKPYDGEIAFMDSQIKRLLDWLEKSKLSEKTLVVVAGDHGEAFNEHGEQGHTLFLYRTNTQVPLLFVDCSITGPIRVPNPVELVDIFPTMLELCAMEPPGAKSKKSLVAALEGQAIADRDCYSESHYGFDAYGYAEQRALTTRDWKYISSTRPELFNLVDDPDEKHNVLDARADVGKDMLTRLLEKYEAMPEGKTAGADQTEEARKALEQLGYVSGGGGGVKSEFLTKGLPDPKDMLSAVLKIGMARAAVQNRNLDDAVTLLEQATKESPNSFQMHFALGNLSLQLGRVDQALAELKMSIELNPRFAPGFTSMGDALAKQNKFEEAVKHYSASLLIEEKDAEAHAKLGMVLAKQGLYDQAMRQYRRALEIFPQYAEVFHEMGFLNAEMDRLKEAVEYYQKALALRPDRAETRYNCGFALLHMRDPVRAVEQLREAVRLKPDYGEAWVNLGVAYGMQGKLNEAKTSFEMAMEIPGSEADAHFNWGVSLEKAGRSADALAQYAMVIKSAPGYVRAVDALVKLSLAQGKPADAIQILREGLKHSPDSINLMNLLASLLATAQEDNLRNGAEAVQWAVKACIRTEYKQPALLETLAAAYAENGRFDEAIQTAHKAIDLAQASGKSNLVSIIDEQLDAYLKHQPYRNPKY